jgi:hypothetical protein
LFDTSGFEDVDFEDLDGPTVGVVVAERLETVADLFDDIVVLYVDCRSWIVGLNIRLLSKEQTPGFTF